MITHRAPQIPDANTLRRSVKRFLDHSRVQGREVSLAFYGGNFLGLPLAIRQALMQTVEGLVCEGIVQGIRFSTRPDTVTPRTVEWLQTYSVRAVELGVQSMMPKILETARRGHTVAHTIAATRLLKTIDGLQIGHQLMLGLPGDTPRAALASARQVAQLKPSFVRIYPTLVLSGSPLAAWYRQGRYRPWQLDQTVQVAKDLLRLFNRHHIPVIRMGLQPDQDLIPGQTILAGPYHPAFGQLVQSALWLACLESVLAKERPSVDPCQCIVHHHPRDDAAIRGQHRQNLQALARSFPDLTLILQADAGLPRGAFRISTPETPAKGPPTRYYRDRLQL